MSEILNQFPDEELPASTVDVARAIRAGRRQRIRTSLAASGAVVAVLAAGATASGWLAARPSPEPAATAPPTCDAAPPRSTSPTWAYFDPLVSEIDTSGVTGYELTMMATSTYFQQAYLSGDGMIVDVMLFATGADPRLFVDGLPDPATGVPAGPLNGVPAYWLPTGDAATLALQWAPGAWALVRPIGTPEWELDDLQGVAMQVARELSFGVGTPVTSPFSLPVPDCLYPAITLTHVNVGEPGRAPGTAFHLGFDRVGTAPPTYGLGYTPDLWVKASPSGSVPPDSTAEYPMRVDDVLGFDVEIVPAGVPGSQAQRLAYAADIFETINVSPGAADDPSAWGDPLAR